MHDKVLSFTRKQCIGLGLVRVQRTIPELNSLNPGHSAVYYPREFGGAFIGSPLSQSPLGPFGRKPCRIAVVFLRGTQSNDLTEMCTDGIRVLGRRCEIAAAVPYESCVLDTTTNTGFLGSLQSCRLGVCQSVLHTAFGKSPSSVTRPHQ